MTIVAVCWFHTLHEFGSLALQSESNLPSKTDFMRRSKDEGSLERVPSKTDLIRCSKDDGSLERAPEKTDLMRCSKDDGSLERA